MSGHPGFSYTGLIFLLMLMIPNLIWVKKYGKVVWMLMASMILGIGHIGIHMQHRRENHA